MIVPRVRQRETKQGIETSTAIFLTDRACNAFNVTHTHTHSLFESKQTIFVSTLAPMLRSIVSCPFNFASAPLSPSGDPPEV